MAKKKKYEKKRSWCWYCDRVFDDDNILVQHQRVKHFQCDRCHRKLNSASGLVIHMAQVHKETMEKVPNAVDGHDSPELEIYGMDGIPVEDLQRHFDGLPIVPYTKGKLIIGDASILPILAAQKASVAAQLAESKSMTVQGDLGAVTGIVSPSAVAAGAAAPTLSSGSSVTSPPIPSVNSAPVSGGVSPTMPGADYWNNPYVMAAYYQQYQQQQQQQQQQVGQYGQNPYSQYYGQNYGQNYYQAYANYYGNAQSVPSAQNPVMPQTVTAQVTEPPASTSTSTAISVVASEPVTIPPCIDPSTNKQVPGTIFTVLSLDRSMEEIRSEMKRYRVIKF